MPELKRNILNFGYGVNFKHEGMLFHSLKVEDLRLTTVQFDSKCSYLVSKSHTQPSSYFPQVLVYCQKIVHM